MNVSEAIEVLERVTAGGDPAEISRVIAWLKQTFQPVAPAPEVSSEPEPGFKVIHLTGGWDSGYDHAPSGDYVVVLEAAPEVPGYGWDPSAEPDEFVPNDRQLGRWRIYGYGNSPKAAWADARDDSFGRDEE